LLRVRVVERVWAFRVVAAHREGLGSRSGSAAAVLVVETGCCPEHVVILVEDVFHSNMILGKLFVTFTERSSAGSSVVSADWSVVSDSEFVLDKLADAGLSVSDSPAFLAIFILFAD